YCPEVGDARDRGHGRNIASLSLASGWHAGCSRDRAVHPNASFVTRRKEAMFMRKTTMLLAGAALVASAACDESGASNPNNSPPIPPAPQPSPELEQPSGGTPVTNTGATLE